MQEPPKQNKTKAALRYSSLLAYVKGRAVAERRRKRRKMNLGKSLEGPLRHKDV